MTGKEWKLHRIYLCQVNISGNIVYKWSLSLGMIFEWIHRFLKNIQIVYMQVWEAFHKLNFNLICLNLLILIYRIINCNMSTSLKYKLVISVPTVFVSLISILEVSVWYEMYSLYVFYYLDCSLNISKACSMDHGKSLMKTM